MAAIHDMICELPPHLSYLKGYIMSNLIKILEEIDDAGIVFLISNNTNGNGFNCALTVPVADGYGVGKKIFSTEGENHDNKPHETIEDAVLAAFKQIPKQLFLKQLQYSKGVIEDASIPV